MKWCASVVAVVLICFGAGCEEDGATSSTCQVAVDVSGAVSLAIDGDAGVACLSQLGADAGIDVEYVTQSGAFDRLGLVVEMVQKGQTGAFPAQVRVTHEDGRVWAALCEVTIDEHTYVEPAELGERYRVVGSGACPEPADGVAGTMDAVSIAPFDFVAEITWGG